MKALKAKTQPSRPSPENSMEPKNLENDLGANDYIKKHPKTLNLMVFFGG